MCYHPYVESKRNVSMQEEQTHRHREEVCGCQGGGKDWSLGWEDEIYLHIKWINTRILQYGAGDSFQYLAINYNGKEYMCRAESILLYRRHEITSTIFFTFKKCVVYISAMKFYMAVKCTNWNDKEYRSILKHDIKEIQGNFKEGDCTVTPLHT